MALVLAKNIGNPSVSCCWWRKMFSGLFMFGVSLLFRQSPSKELIANPNSLIEENTRDACEAWTPSNFRKLLPHFRLKKKFRRLTYIHDKLKQQIYSQSSGIWKFENLFLSAKVKVLASSYNISVLFQDKLRPMVCGCVLGISSHRVLLWTLFPFPLPHSNDDIRVHSRPTWNFIYLFMFISRFIYLFMFISRSVATSAKYWGYTASCRDSVTKPLGDKTAITVSVPLEVKGVQNMLLWRDESFELEVLPIQHKSRGNSLIKGLFFEIIFFRKHFCLSTFSLLSTLCLRLLLLWRDTMTTLEKDNI